MSHYLGSKARHADEIIKHLLDASTPGQTYVEPFVGGANVLANIPLDHQFYRRIAGDRNKWMVALHRALANGWQPPQLVTPKEFNEMKKWEASPRLQAEQPDKYAPELIGFVACGCSFGSMWFSSFAKDDAGKPKGTRCRQSAESCLRDVPGLTGAEFYHSDYDKLAVNVMMSEHGNGIPQDALWYCDPPYANTTGYEGADQVIKVGDSAGANRWLPHKFWQWANGLVDAGATVFVSEYTGPYQFAQSIYKAPDSPELPALRKRHRELQADMESTQAQMDDALFAIQHEESKGRVWCDEQAAKWKVVWEREVHVNIAGGAVAAAREAGDADAAPKKETEKLFRRDP